MGQMAGNVNSKTNEMFGKTEIIRRAAMRSHSGSFYVAITLRVMSRIANPQ